MSDDKILLPINLVDELARTAAKKIKPLSDEAPRVFAVPRGGVPAMLAMRAHTTFEVVDHPHLADYIVDDLIDSGATMAHMMRESEMHWSRPNVRRAPAKPVVLIDKPNLPEGHPHRGWIVFPWEGDAVGSFEDNVTRMLQFIGEDVGREGLAETPKRVAKAWAHWASGYNVDPADILKTFEDGASGVNEMVMVRDIPFYTHCEHHLAPFFGRATVAYIPNGKIVGLSKLNRLVDCFARRLQVQERLTTQIADAINDHLQPLGVGVVVKARHLCMESRGVCQQGHETITSALRGALFEGPARQEFLSLAK